MIISLPQWLNEFIDCSFLLHETNSKIFTQFEINATVDSHFTDIDPDYHAVLCESI